VLLTLAWCRAAAFGFVRDAGERSEELVVRSRPAVVRADGSRRHRVRGGLHL